MRLHDLQPNPGSKKSRKRVGRGIAAGQGKTAGRGAKGQNKRFSRIRLSKGMLFFIKSLPLSG